MFWAYVCEIGEHGGLVVERQDEIAHARSSEQSEELPESLGVGGIGEHVLSTVGPHRVDRDEHAHAALETPVHELAERRVEERAVRRALLGPAPGLAGVDPHRVEAELGAVLEVGAHLGTIETTADLDHADGKLGGTVVVTDRGDRRQGDDGDPRQKTSCHSACRLETFLKLHEAAPE